MTFGVTSAPLRASATTVEAFTMGAMLTDTIARSTGTPASRSAWSTLARSACAAAAMSTTKPALMPSDWR